MSFFKNLYDGLTRPLFKSNKVPSTAYLTWENEVLITENHQLFSRIAELESKIERQMDALIEKEKQILSFETLYREKKSATKAPKSKRK